MQGGAEQSSPYLKEHEPLVPDLLGKMPLHMHVIG